MSKASRIASWIAVLALAALALPFPPENEARANGGGQLFEQLNRGGCGNTALVYGTNRQWAQTFTAQSAHTVTSVKLPLGRNGLPGTVTAAITPTDPLSGHPICNNDMASGNIDGDLLPLGDPVWTQVSFSGSCNLIAGTRYAIVLRALSGIDDSKCVRWGFCSNEPLYNGGDMEWMITQVLCNWSNDTIGDFLFEVWGYPSEVWVAPSPTGSDNNTGTEAQPFATIQKGIDTVADCGTVHVAAGTYEHIHVSKSVTVDGAGASSTVIDGGGISAYNTVLDFMSNPGEEVTISGFTIQNGYQDSVGGIFIQSNHTLNLNDCIIRNNTGLDAGGILNKGTLTMNRCTVNDNSGAKGGGIQNRGTLYLVNCTISGNSASGSEGGGGIYNDANTEMTSEYTTIANNHATGASSRGGGFNNWGHAKFESTIVANNTAGVVAYNNGFTESAQDGVTDSNGYNLDSENSCGFNVRTDLINTNPLLSPLQDNGGPTFTHALLHGSPAIDHGIGEGFPSIDQRGVPRWQGSTCDTGAYELAQASVATATGTGTASFSTYKGYITTLTVATSTTCGNLSGFSFPHGFFSFTITGITLGSTVMITITLPTDIPANTQYWKCINGQWVDCTSLLDDNDGDNILTLTIIDGGLGDSSPTPDGMIVDPGGPGIPAPAPAPIPAPVEQAEGASTGEGRSTILRSADMKARYLRVTPQQAYINQPVTIATNVINSGSSIGTYRVALKIDNRIEQTRMVSVSGGSAQQVKFTVYKSQPGTYNVAIGSEKNTFTILSGDKAAISPPVDEGIIVLLLFGALVLATILVLIVAFRRPAE